MKFAAFLGRILFCSFFIVSFPDCFKKETIQMAADHGLPAPEMLVPLAGVMALAGAVCVLVGYRAQLGAWMLVAFLVPLTLVMHSFWDVADPGQAGIQEMLFMKNLTMLGGALVIAYFGAGPGSV